ncbi:putative Bet v I/Major latex protein [Helianthus annuus]|nr:putative Bet v I/Major latex protein [Helianthus annuus]
MSVTLDLQITCQLPADKVLKVIGDFDNLVPKLNPQFIKSVETVQGSGDVGTIKNITFGDAVPYKSAKYKVDAVDPSNYSYDYSIIEGDSLIGILDSINHHVKIVPSSDGGSVYKQTVVYNCKGAEKPSEEFLKTEKEVFESNFKAMEAYAVAHPEVY